MITFEFQGLERFSGYMKDVTNRVSDWKKANEYIAARGWKDVMDHFSKEEGPDGKWKSLSEWTLRARRKGKGSGTARILQDTGTMRRSVKFRGTSSDAEVYTGIEYAATHQYGRTARIGKRSITIPKRPFLWLSDKARKAIGDISLNYIIRGKAVE